MEKLVFALIYTTRKLRRYFQAHVLHVLTDKPLQQILSKPEVSGRLAKWAIKLGDHTIKYKTRIAFKGQVMADFLTESMTKEENREKEPEKVTPRGTSNRNPFGTLPLDFPSTSNEAEYEALLAGLRMAQRVKAKRIKAHVDSLLATNQVKGDYEAKDPKMV
ncbi:uncharacterized protein LOC143583212 [Bidens hawaiensis]|uniref:uncharacterized protein LOC143583212 n=1 Tax=Bidens hawaiensis TaxID=980011 RepID=UPI004049E3B1